MTQNIETSKINAAVDLLIKGDVDLSNAGYFPTKGDKVARPSVFKIVFIWLVAVLTCPI